MRPEKKMTDDAAQKQINITRSGVILMESDGVVVWCDRVASTLLKGDVRGVSWQELTNLFLSESRADSSVDSLGSVDINTLHQSITKSVRLDRDSENRQTLDVCIDPVRDRTTGVLSQLVITITPVSRNDAEKTEQGGVASVTANPASCSCDTEVCGGDLHRAILLATQAGLLIFDTSGLILDANREAAKYLATDISGITQRGIYDLLEKERVRHWQCAVTYVLKHRREKRFVETSGRHHYQIDLQPVNGTDGKIEKVVAVMRDITVQWVCEIRYRELYESMAKGVVVCESPDGIGESFLITDMNKSGLAICDVQDEQVVGRELSEILRGLEASGLRAVMQRVLTTSEAEHCTAWLDHDDGKKSWLDAYVFTLPNRELVVVFEDISLKYETEQALRKSREEWEKIFDALNDIIIILDKDMRIVRANRTAYRMFDKKFGALVGRNCYEVFQGFNRPCQGCPVPSTSRDCCIHEGLVYSDKIDKTLDVRSSPIFESNGTLKWVVQVARDVSSNLKKGDYKELLAKAIEQASESILISDREGKLLYVNNAFCTTTGYTRDELTESYASILKSGAQDNEFYKEMWESLVAGNVWHGRMTNRKKDGTLFKEDVTISPIVDSAGNITNYLALKQDVTREESLEQELQQAKRMEAIGSLAGGLAHDFNNILSVIMGYSHIAKSRLEQDHPVQTDIDQILAGGERAVNLVKQVLTFSRGDSRQQFRPLKVQYIIKEVLKRLHSTLPSHIELKENIDLNCAPIQADPGLIHQLLVNLFTNAKQAIGSDDGVITVTLSEHIAKEVRVSQDENGKVAPGKYLKFTVEDTGCGMEKKMLSRIFDPFFTTRSKEYGTGTGLGLAVVHGIVRKHCGEIFVESTVGEGTVFSIFFSVTEDQEQISARNEGPEVQPGGSEKIMIVDDEDVVATVHEKILSKLGYAVSSYTNSLEALEAFMKDPGCCDLVITDMSMPNMTGTRLAKEMLKLRPELPIILLTGYSKEVDKEGALRLGIRDFLLKPVQAEVLSASIRNVLGETKKTNTM
jgi:PAS domain S-box-containing protein